MPSVICGKRFKKNVLTLQHFMLKQPQIEVETRHRFANGLYYRTAKMPAGARAIGKKHRFENINVVSEGELYVATEDGIKLVKAPYMFTAPAGVKRVGFILKDTVWTSITACKSTNVEDAEQELFYPDEVA